MKTKNVKIPKRLKDFSLSQMRDTLQLLSQIDKDNPEITVKDMAELVSVFTKTEYVDVLEWDVYSIAKIYRKGLLSFNNYEEKDPPDEIEINGSTYVRHKFEKGKSKGGWFVDIKTRHHEFLKAPELLASFNYIEKGKEYAQKDKNGHVVNPTNERAEIFKEHFPPDVFMNLHGFFLKTSAKWKNAFLVLKTHETLKAMMKAKKLTNSTSAN